MIQPHAQHLAAVPSDDAGHQQWRAEQMSRLGESHESDASYSSWRDDDDRRRWQALQDQDAALSYMQTLISA